VNPLLVFDTTHHALWAEQIAVERGVGAQVVPAPPDSGAKCDLALEYLPEDGNVLLPALDDAHVAYRQYLRSGGPGRA
jgi:hypothetical protein